MLYSTFIYFILLVIPFTESLRCSQNCTFQGLQLNSSISSNLCPPSPESTNDTDQTCEIKLNIDFTRGLVNGSFLGRQQSSWIADRLDVTTHFYLNDTSVIVEIDYRCSTNDYCAFEFVREILSPALAAVRFGSLRQELIARLYHSNNTSPIECTNNQSCPQNASVCYRAYVRSGGRFGRQPTIQSGCESFSDLPEIFWNQAYMPYNQQDSSDAGLFYCNKTECASNTTVIETFQWLAREYILPLNFSVLNVTTTSKPTTTTTVITSTTISTTTTTSNTTSCLFEQLNIFISIFLTILVLKRNLFQI